MAGCAGDLGLGFESNRKANLSYERMDQAVGVQKLRSAKMGKYLV